LSLVGLLLTLVVLLLFFVLGTQTGLRTLIAVTEDLAPGMIEASRVEGRILGRLEIDGFALKLPVVEASVGTLVLDWSPGALLTGTLRVRELLASDIEVLTAPTDEDKPAREPLELPSIKLPIGIDIDQVLVERLRVQASGAAPESAIELTRAELSATANGSVVEIRALDAELAQPSARARAQGQVELKGAYPVELTLDWRFRQAPVLSIAGEGRIAGDLDALTVTHRISGSVRARLQALIEDALNAPRWQAEIDLEAIELPELVADAPRVDLQAELKSEGDLQRASLTGSLRGSAPDVAEMGRLAADLDVQWAVGVLTVNALRLTESMATEAAGARIELTGELNTNPAVPTFTAQALWERLRWPLAGEPVVQSPMGSLGAEGALDAFTYRLTTDAFGEQIPETRLALVGSGDQQRTDIAELTIETLNGQIAGKGSLGWSPELVWDLAVTAREIDPGRQWVGLDGSLGLKADSRGSLKDGFSYALSLDAAMADYPRALLNLSGSGTAAEARVAELSIETLGGVIEGQGEARWSPTATWTFALSARDINPGSHYAGLDGRVGLTAETSGGLEEGFAFELQGDAALADYPPTRLDLAGIGTATSATLERLAIEVIGGRIDGTGELAWSPVLSWDAALTLADLDPGEVLADWPGRLGGRVQTQGRILDAGADGNATAAAHAGATAGPDLTLSVSDFGGELRGYPVALRGDLAVKGRSIQLRTLEANSGDTRLTLEGQVDERIDLRYAFNSPSLAALLPGVKGRLEAQGGVAGTTQQPQIRLALDGRDIEQDGQGIERISASAELGLGQQSPLRLVIDGSNLILGAQRFERLQVRGDGTTGSHQVSLDLDGNPLVLALSMEAGLSTANAYAGRLTRLSLDTQDYDNWALDRAAPFEVAGSVIEAGPLCLSNQGTTRGCVAFRQPEAGRFSASLDLQRLGFDLLDAITPDTTSIEGYLTAKAEFEGRADQLFGSAELRVPEGGVEIVLPRASETLVFTGTRLDVRAGASGIDARFELPIEGAGRVDAELGLPGFRFSAIDTQPLSGRIAIDLDGLDRFARLAPDLSGTQGSIQGTIGLSGRLTKPGIRADVAARDIAVSVPSIGLEVRELNLALESESADAIRVNGGALVGGGQLNLDGQAVGIGSAEPTLSVTLNGRDLKVADSKEYKAQVSLDLEAGFGPGGGAVRGELSVPTATIMPRTIPSGAIQPSPDVVLEEDTDKPAGLPLSVDVLARLGDQVLLEAFGLRGRLEGQLRITQQPGRPLLGSGELQVIDGTYRVSLPGLGLLTSVGRPLVINKGIVLFANTPLDNPGIILNAQREGGDLTAGVRVLGTLRNPKLAFFSESDPNLSQSEITSYLVTGIPPKRGGKQEDRSLSVGTYIAPKLFMEYDSSLGDQSDSVKMRYDLSKRIQLQSETGDAQGFDIFYKFEN
jgi:autotransporter translocation and assembly factor TamB